MVGEERRPIHLIGYAICQVAHEAKSPFIISYATTGISVAMISRFRPDMPILAITANFKVARRLRLFYHVYPISVNSQEIDLPRSPENIIKFVIYIFVYPIPELILTCFYIIFIY